MKSTFCGLPEFAKTCNVVNEIIYAGYSLKAGYSVIIRASLNLDAMRIQLMILDSSLDDTAIALVLDLPRTIQKNFFDRLAIPVDWLFRPGFDPRKALQEYIETILSHGRIEIKLPESSSATDTERVLTLKHALYCSEIIVPAAELEKYFDQKREIPPTQEAAAEPEPQPTPDVQ